MVGRRIGVVALLLAGCGRGPLWFFDGTPCSSGAETCYDPRLATFTRSFSHGFLGSIDGDYAEHFDRAVDVVADVCAAE